MSIDILGTSWDQCWSMVQHSFTSMETRRLIKMDSPGQPPQLSHSSWTMNDSERFHVPEIGSIWNQNRKLWFCHHYIQECLVYGLLLWGRGGNGGGGGGGELYPEVSCSCTITVSVCFCECAFSVTGQFEKEKFTVHFSVLIVTFDSSFQIKKVLLIPWHCSS